MQQNCFVAVSWHFRLFSHILSKDFLPDAKYWMNHTRISFLNLEVASRCTALATETWRSGMSGEFYTKGLKAHPASSWSTNISCLWLQWSGIFCCFQQGWFRPSDMIEALQGPSLLMINSMGCPLEGALCWCWTLWITNIEQEAAVDTPALGHPRRIPLCNAAGHPSLHPPTPPWAAFCWLQASDWPLLEACWWSPSQWIEMHVRRVQC